MQVSHDSSLALQCDQRRARIATRHAKSERSRESCSLSVQACVAIVQLDPTTCVPPSVSVPPQHDHLGQTTPGKRAEFEEIARVKVEVSLGSEVDARCACCRRVYSRGSLNGEQHRVPYLPADRVSLSDRGRQTSGMYAQTFQNRSHVCPQTKC